MTFFAHPGKIPPVIVITKATPEMKTWMCLICGWIYDEEAGDPEHGIPPGTRWEDVPEDWHCPECDAGKADFQMAQL